MFSSRVQIKFNLVLSFHLNSLMNVMRASPEEIIGRNRQRLRVWILNLQIFPADQACWHSVQDCKSDMVLGFPPSNIQVSDDHIIFRKILSPLGRVVRLLYYNGSPIIDDCSITLEPSGFSRFRYLTGSTTSRKGPGLPSRSMRRVEVRPGRLYQICEEVVPHAIGFRISYLPMVASQSPASLLRSEKERMSNTVNFMPDKPNCYVLLSSSQFSVKLDSVSSFGRIQSFFAREDMVDML
ncbi:hypothetical protein NPIL_581031 [Nephila pilipes]|uniref:Uncharacterized protein n=1 Tax=Nephila pilipes TaxID=299642 RepID=A0A8X6MD84_NEPPI|nr:hypothetical protein NPIL_581031 [Nephila pilipes]